MDELPSSSFSGNLIILQNTSFNSVYFHINEDKVWKDNIFVEGTDGLVNDSVSNQGFEKNQTDYIFDRGDVRVIFLILYTIVFCSCFFGNLMVILVVTLHWRMRSITNFCLANLAFADLCVGIFCVYQNIVTYLMDSWIFGEFMCKMYHFINSLSTTASVLILVVICIERYLAIIHPMTCKQMLTLKRLRVTIVLVWTLSAAISSPRFYYISTLRISLENGKEEILCIPHRLKYDSKVMDMISMTVLFLIPLIIISVLYTQIGIVLWKSSNNKMPAVQRSPENSSSSGGISQDGNVRVNLNHMDHRLNSSESLQMSPHSKMMQSKSETLCTCKLKDISRTERKSKSSSFANFMQFKCKRSNLKCTLSASSNAARLKEVEPASFAPSKAICANVKDATRCSQCHSPVFKSNKMDKSDTIFTSAHCSGASPAFPATLCYKEHKTQQIIENAVTESVDSITCCKGKLKCRPKCIFTEHSASQVDVLPPSPFYCKETGTQKPEPSKTEPLILVKFENQKQTSRKSKGKQIQRCTIIYIKTNENEQRLEEVKTENDYAQNKEKDETNPEMLRPKIFSYSSSYSHDNFFTDNEPSTSGSTSFAVRDRDHTRDIVAKPFYTNPNFKKIDPEFLDISSANATLNVLRTSTERINSSIVRCPLHGCSKQDPGHISLAPQLLSQASPDPALAKRPKRMRILRSSKYGTGALQSRRRIIRMLIMVVLTFAVCHLPFHARKMWQYWSPQWAKYQAGSAFSTLFTSITFLVMYANSGINPILYAFMSKKFRMSFKDLLCCKMRHSLRISRNASVRSTHAIQLSQTGM